MSEQHTPEPWEPSTAYDDARRPTPEIRGPGALPRLIALVYIEGDRDRIVACVNACEGIPTEVLERLAGRPAPRLAPKGQTLRGATPS